MKASQRTAELRYAAWARKVAAEEPLERIVLAGMDLWAAALLDAITDPRLAGLESAPSARTTWETFLRFGLEPRIGALFRGAFDATVPPALTAAAGGEDFDEMLAQELEKLDPAEFQQTVQGQFGEEFNATRKSTDHSGYRYEQQHIADVHDRLVIWPENAWEELRPNIEEAMADATDLEEVKAKIARELGIDAETRRLRAEITEIDKRLDTDPDMPGPEWDALQARKRQLWRQHDESFGDWEWKARRIARTEVQGAVEGGQHAAAEHAQAVTGQVWYRRWLCVTGDTKVRADGITHIARRRHVGTVVTIHTRSGRSITTTPEHRVLTSRGWVPAQFTHEGDELLQITLVDPVEAPDVQDVPANIAEAFDAAMEAETVEVRPVPVAVDLNGETVYGQVEVVPTDRDLAADLVPSFGERGSELVLPPADLLAEALLFGERRADDRADRLRSPTVRLGCGLTPGALPLRVALDTELPGLAVPAERNTRIDEHAGSRRPGDADSTGDGADGLAAGVPLDYIGRDGGALSGAAALVLCRRCGGVRAEPEGVGSTTRDAACLHDPGDCLGARAELARDCRGAQTAEVQLDDVVRIEVKPFAGHVYDLSTNSGWFSANGLVIHNSTPDDRTRMSHRVADGQVVGPGEKFRVGAAELQYPGDPFANAPSETIQCRCTVLLWSAAELEAELQGSEGSMGAVRPGGVRRGPDDESAVAAAIDLEQAEQDAWDENGGVTAAGRRGTNKGGDPLNRGRFSHWIDGVSGVEQWSAPDREGRRFGVGFPGKLPKDAPARSEDWADAYRGARRLNLDAAPPAPYERRETATIDKLNAAHLISPADDPLRMALNPPNGADPDIGAARAAAGLNLLNVRAVTVADLAGARGSEFTGATADILVLPDGTFVEAKEQTGNARTVRRKLRRAREQARVVIGEAPNISVAEAEEIITGLVSDPGVSPHLDELRILAGDGAVYWRRGR